METFTQLQTMTGEMNNKRYSSVSISPHKETPTSRMVYMKGQKKRKHGLVRATSGRSSSSSHYTHTHTHTGSGHRRQIQHIMKHHTTSFSQRRTLVQRLRRRRHQNHAPGMHIYAMPATQQCALDFCHDPKKWWTASANAEATKQRRRRPRHTGAGWLTASPRARVRRRRGIGAAPSSPTSPPSPGTLPSGQVMSWG